MLDGPCAGDEHRKAAPYNLHRASHGRGEHEGHIVRRSCAIRRVRSERRGQSCGKHEPGRAIRQGHIDDSGTVSGVEEDIRAGAEDNYLCDFSKDFALGQKGAKRRKPRWGRNAGTYELAKRAFSPIESRSSDLSELAIRYLTLRLVYSQHTWRSFHQKICMVFRPYWHGSLWIMKLLAVVSDNHRSLLTNPPSTHGDQPSRTCVQRYSRSHSFLCPRQNHMYCNENMNRWLLFQ